MTDRRTVGPLGPRVELLGQGVEGSPVVDPSRGLLVGFDDPAQTLEVFRGSAREVVVRLKILKRLITVQFTVKAREPLIPTRLLLP